MSRNIFLNNISKGDILFLSEPKGYRENHEKNHAYAPMLPDFVVVDDVHCGVNGWQADFVGFPYKEGAIVFELDDHDFFSHVGNIEDTGFDIDDVREQPYVFSNYYKIGGHLRADNKTVLYLDSLLSGMHNFNINKQGNNEEMGRLFAKFLNTGTFFPSEMAYIINRLIKGLHQTAIKYHDGDPDEAMKMVIHILREKSKEMDTSKK